MITDHISDMLTRLRNAAMVKHEKVSMPSTKMKIAIAEILKEEGYIDGYGVEENNHQGILHIDLKYGPNNEQVIRGLKRVSKPGLRIYVKATEIPKVLNGLGIAILSTSKGVLVDKSCRKDNIGGELLCYVW